MLEDIHASYQRFLSRHLGSRSWQQFSSSPGVRSWTWALSTHIPGQRMLELLVPYGFELVFQRISPA